MRRIASLVCCVMLIMLALLFVYYWLFIGVGMR